MTYQHKRIINQRITCCGCGKARLQNAMVLCEEGYVCKKCLNGTSKETKYHNKPTTYKGVTYQSKLEAFVAKELDYLQMAKEILEWDRQIRIPLEIGDAKLGICYYCDFKVMHNDGSIEYIEVKSKATKTALWKLKWAIFEHMTKNNPNVLLTVKEG